MENCKNHTHQPAPPTDSHQECDFFFKFQKYGKAKFSVTEYSWTP